MGGSTLTNVGVIHEIQEIQMAIFLFKIKNPNSHQLRHILRFRDVCYEIDIPAPGNKKR
jgi:hypothetical protein